MPGKRRPVFQDPTKLETRSPICPELDRNGHRARAEVYGRMEGGGTKEVQNPLEENLFRGHGNENTSKISYWDQVTPR